MDDEIQRWTAKRRRALVLSIIKGETSAQEAARKHGLTVADVEKWLELGLAGMENQLRSRPHDDEELKDARIKQLERKIGQMALDDILQEQCDPTALRRGGRPTSEGSSPQSFAASHLHGDRPVACRARDQEQRRR